jgi:uncharacterized protein YebE (UPF0316 family)
METSLKKSGLGSLYVANAEAIQNTCKFKVAEASEQIFELVENTWVVYSTRSINTNEGVPSHEHDPDLPEQLRRHGYGRTWMLHSDYGSRDLSR